MKPSSCPIVLVVLALSAGPTACSSDTAVAVSSDASVLETSVDSSGDSSVPDGVVVDAATPDSGDAAAQHDGGGGGDTGVDAAPDDERGLSAWVYDNQQSWVDAMKAHNAKASQSTQLRYLFPYAGDISIPGSAYGSQSLVFDEGGIDFYAGVMPSVRMLPIVGSGDGNEFASWSDGDQRLLANDVADALLAKAAVAGAQIDIEPFHTEHQPFYEELGKRLHAQGKLLTVFTGESSGAIYSIADVVVLSGYDLGISPVTPAEYKTVLSDLVATALQSANAAGARLMVGVPIAASWEEYAYQSGTCSNNTGATQEQWFSAALAAVCAHKGHGSYMGLSLWGFYGDALEIPHGSGCFRNPGAVSPANWTALANWGSGC